MRESLKLQCRVDDVIDKEWRESETLNAEMITEALVDIIDDLIDDVDTTEELRSMHGLMFNILGGIESKLASARFSARFTSESTCHSETVRNRGAHAARNNLLGLHIVRALWNMAQ